MAVLPDEDARKLRELREQTTVVSCWEFGRIINKLFGGRAPHGESLLKEIARELEWETGESMLQQYRRLARLWTREDAVEADQLYIKIRMVIKFLALDGMASRLDAAEREAMRQKRLELMRKYAQKRDEQEVLQQINEIKTKYEKDLPAIRSRKVSDTRRTVARLFKELVRALNDVTTTLEPAARTELKQERTALLKSKTRVLTILQRNVLSL